MADKTNSMAYEVSIHGLLRALTPTAAAFMFLVSFNPRALTSPDEVQRLLEYVDGFQSTGSYEP